jgi:sensor histidine kinase regulating citrate/malate metabolism
MSFKSFITKSALRMKGVSKEQAEEIAKQLEEHPEIAESLKALEQNKEVKALMEKIQKEISKRI